MKNLYKSLLLIWLGHLVLDFMTGVWPIYKTIAGLDLAKASLIAGIGMFIGEGMQLIFGYFSDRGHRKKLAALGVIMASSVSFLAYTESYWLLFVMVLFTFLGSGSFHPAAAGMVSNWSSTNKSMLITIFASGGMLGAAMSQSVFSHAFEYLEGHTMFLFLPGLCFALWVVLHRFPCAGKTTQSISTKELISRLTPLKSELFRLYLLQVLTQTLIIAFMFLLPDIMQQRDYPQWLTFGGAHLFFMIGAALLSIPAGALSDKFGHKPIIISSLLICMFCYYLFLSGAQLSIIQTCILLFFTGGFMGLIQPIIISAGTSIVPDDLSGITSATLMGAASCIAGFGLAGVGLISGYFEEEPAIKTLQIIGTLYIFAIALSFQGGQKKSCKNFTPNVQIIS